MQAINYKHELKKCGGGFLFYKNPEHPEIFLTINSNDNTVSGECNDLELNFDWLNHKYLEMRDPDLDQLIQLIDKEYGTSAPGFSNDSDLDENCDTTDDKSQDFKENLYWNNKRTLTIYTWGKKRRKSKPLGSECNFNAGVISGKKKGLDLKKLNGLSPDVQRSVASASGYCDFMKNMVKKIENNNLSTISINCTAGRHRSVACAELLKKLVYPQSSIYHCELCKST